MSCSCRARDRFHALDEIGGELLGAAIQVHRALGPGLLESVYEECLAFELADRGLDVARQVQVPIEYGARRLQSSLRMDLLVGGRVVVETKSTAAVDRIHRAQLLTYLRLSGHRLGYLLNFNVPLLREGIVRVVT